MEAMAGAVVAVVAGTVTTVVGVVAVLAVGRVVAVVAGDVLAVDGGVVGAGAAGAWAAGSASSTATGALERPPVAARYPVRPTMAAALVAPATFRARRAGWRRRPGGGGGIVGEGWGMISMIRSLPERNLGMGSFLAPNLGSRSEEPPRNGTGRAEGRASGWGP
jgi:hypothetical protein